MPFLFLEKDMYKELINRVVTEGTDGEYRNGYRRSVFGVLLRFDLAKRFP